MPADHGAMAAHPGRSGTSGAFAGGTGAGGGAPPAAPSGAWWTLASVSVGLFLAVLSTTLVSVALPSIGRALAASPVELEWVVDTYVVVYAAMLVAGGSAGDRFGRKGLYLFGAGVFGFGSLVAGLAPSVAVLLAGRVVQGIGAAFLTPGSLTIIRAVFPDPRQRARAIGLWSTSSGLALAVGAPLGGVIVAGLGWRWVFLMNVPLTGLAILGAARAVPRLPRPPAPARPDVAGAVLVTAGIALLATAVIQGQDVGWLSPPVVLAFVLGAAGIVAFVAVERRRAHPLIDVGLFARPVFAAANIAAFVSFFAFVGALVYFSAYFQQAQGRSAIQTGLDMTAIGAAYAVAATLSGRLVGRVGERWPLVVGLAVSGLATLALLHLQPASGIGTIWPIFLMLGAGVGLCGTPISTAAMSTVAVARAGQASAAINATRQIGQVFGVAVLGALVYAGLPAGPAGNVLPPAQAAQFVSGLHHALLLSGVLLLATAALTVVLIPGRGGGRSGARAR